MTQTKTLLSIEVVTDDDSGIYAIGELDYRVPCDAVEWIEKKRADLASWLRHLAVCCETRQPPFHGDDDAN